MKGKGKENLCGVVGALDTRQYSYPDPSQILTKTV
jgi:hypothetical protein